MIRPLLAPLVLILTLAFALSPLASNGFNGFTPGQFPVVQDHWPVQPVGWAFSIWGLIYLWLTAGAVYGLLRARGDLRWTEMRAPLAISLLIGVFWIAVANLQPLAATVMIIFMAAAAIVALLRAPDGFWAVGPVGLYAGWLTAATGVAIAVVLGGYGVLSAQVAALVLLALVLGVALSVQWQRPGAFSYGFGVAWALMGVIVANLDPVNLPVIGLAGFGITALVALVILRKEAL
jgi:hypothetical protein